MPDWIAPLANLGFAVVIGGYLIRFITNHLMTEVKGIREDLKELAKEIRAWRRNP